MAMKALELTGTSTRSKAWSKKFWRGWHEGKLFPMRMIVSLFCNHTELVQLIMEILERYRPAILKTSQVSSQFFSNCVPFPGQYFIKNKLKAFTCNIVSLRKLPGGKKSKFVAKSPRTFQNTPVENNNQLYFGLLGSQEGLFTRLHSFKPTG